MSFVIGQTNYFGFGFTTPLLRYVIALENSRHFLIQSQVTPTAILTHSRSFSRALGCDRLQVFS